MKKMKIRLDCSTQTYEQVSGPESNSVGLYKKGFLAADATIIIYRPRRMGFGHKDQVFIPFRLSRGKRFILWEDLSRAIKQKVREIFPKNPLLVRRKTQRSAQ